MNLCVLFVFLFISLNCVNIYELKVEYTYKSGRFLLTEISKKGTVIAI